MSDPRVEEVLRHLAPEGGFRPWHGGPTVLGALRGVSVEWAVWKPFPDRHSIWELALHVAYWHYVVWRRLSGAPRGGFERSPSDWPAVPDDPTEEAWAEDRALVRLHHGRVVALMGTLDPEALEEPAGDDTETTRMDLVTGALLHETYHAGQIQLMKRLARSAGV